MRLVKDGGSLVVCRNLRVRLRAALRVGCHATRLTSASYWGPDMRKLLTLLFYLAMVGGGSWAVYEWIVFGGRNIVLKAGIFPALFGAYLIWMDFLSPNRERL